MRAYRLLERVAACEAGYKTGFEAGSETGGARLRATRVDALIESILAHLLRILNTRQGSVPIDPAFGVPDFTNLGVDVGVGGVGEWMGGAMNDGPDRERSDGMHTEARDGVGDGVGRGMGDGVGDGVSNIAAAIARTLRRSEPRLLSPRVRRISADTDILSLAFAIDGLIAADDREIPISIATRVSASGRVSLQRA